MPLAIFRRFALLFSFGLAATIASCSSGSTPAPQRNSDSFVKQQLDLLDSLAQPAGVESAIWTALTHSMRAQLQAQLAGKIAAKATTGNASAAVVSYDAGLGSLSWSFTSQGDYDQNGEVNVADLTQIAVNYQASTGGTGPFPIGTVRAVVDGDGNGEINAADITPIAQNLGCSVFSYSVYAAAGMTDYPASNTAPNGAGAQLVETIPLSLATGTPNQARLQFTSDVSGAAGATVFWVRPNDTADGSGSLGTPSSPVGPGAAQPISGTVKTSANVALAGVTMTLSGASTFTATTAANGTFSFSGVPAGNYTLTPSKANCAFTPATRAVSSGSGKDFTASLNIADTPYGFTIDLFGDGQKVVHFEKGTVIDVYIDNSGIGVPGWQASFDAAIRDASMKWNEIAQPWGLFTVRQTTVEAEAEMVFTWVPTLGGAKMGEAQLSVTTPSTLNLPVTIDMAVANIFGPATAPIVRMITVHEMGHALGIWDHSDRDTDIMFPSVGFFEDPSPRDVLTMYTLYNTAPDYTAGARGTSSAEPGRTVTVRME